MSNEREDQAEQNKKDVEKKREQFLKELQDKQDELKDQQKKDLVGEIITDSKKIFEKKDDKKEGKEENDDFEKLQNMLKEKEKKEKKGEEKEGKKEEGTVEFIVRMLDKIFGQPQKGQKQEQRPAESAFDTKKEKSESKEEEGFKVTVFSKETDTRDMADKQDTLHATQSSFKGDDSKEVYRNLDNDPMMQLFNDFKQDKPSQDKFGFSLDTVKETGDMALTFMFPEKALADQFMSMAKDQNLANDPGQGPQSQKSPFPMEPTPPK